MVTPYEHTDSAVVLVLFVKVEPVLHADHLGTSKVGDVVVARLRGELTLDVGARAVIAGEAAVVRAGTVKLLSIAHVEALAHHAQHQRPPRDAAVKQLEPVSRKEDVSVASRRALLREPRDGLVRAVPTGRTRALSAARGTVAPGRRRRRADGFEPPGQREVADQEAQRRHREHPEPHHRRNPRARPALLLLSHLRAPPAEDGNPPVSHAPQP